MKFFVFLTSFLLSVTALASLDSVGVFHRPDKVVVLVTDNNPSGRIQEFMTALGTDELFIWKNSDQSISIRCGRSSREASCTFRFFPSESVQIENKSVNAFISAEELASADFSIDFESSMGDRFILKNTAQGLNFEASKKITPQSLR